MSYIAAAPTSSLYQDVVSTFGSLTATRTGADKRTQERVNIEGCATVIPCSGPDARKPLKAFVRDASPSGIAIVMSRPFRVGDRFVVVLTKTRSVLCEVMNWNPVDAGTFRVGGRFIAELRQDDQEKPAAPAPRAAAPAKVSLSAIPNPQLSPDELAAAFRPGGESQDVTADEEQVRLLEERLARVSNSTSK